MKTRRNLSGVYFRVKDTGEWCNVCFEELTREEQDNVMTGKDEVWLRSLVKQLSFILNEIGEKFDLKSL